MNMTHIGPARRAVVLVTALVAGAAASVVGGTVSLAATPQGHRIADRSSARSSAAPQRTTLRFAVRGCDRCRIRLYQARDGRRGVWQSHQHRVEDGTVSFDVPTRRTHGMSASVLPPWERHGIPTGYTTMVVFRYAGERAGAMVSRREGRTRRRASGCWAGTTAAEVTVPLRVRKVRVEGTTGRTTGSVAWTPRTQQWWRPMLRTSRGILGAQAIIPCKRP